MKQDKIISWNWLGALRQARHGSGRHHPTLGRSGPVFFSSQSICIWPLSCVVMGYMRKPSKIACWALMAVFFGMVLCSGAFACSTPHACCTKGGCKRMPARSSCDLKPVGTDRVTVPDDTALVAPVVIALVALPAPRVPVRRVQVDRTIPYSPPDLFLIHSSFLI